MLDWTKIGQLNSLMNSTSTAPQSTYDQYSSLFPMAQMTNPYQNRQENQLAQAQTMKDQAVKGAGQAAINAGKQFIGKSKYVWGGGRTQKDIENGKFDCSGFVNYAFKSAGVNLGNGNTDSIAKKGVAVNPSNLQPGDIVFFDTYKKNGHVGIYVGNGKFIGSQTKTGVAVQDMTNGYWKQKFNGNVRRV